MARKQYEDPEHLTTIRGKNKTISNLRSVQESKKETNEEIINRLVAFYKKWKPRIKVKKNG